jgi:hypothetical protein
MTSRDRTFRIFSLYGCNVLEIPADAEEEVTKRDTKMKNVEETPLSVEHKLLHFETLQTEVPTAF